MVSASPLRLPVSRCHFNLSSYLAIASLKDSKASGVPFFGGASNCPFTKKLGLKPRPSRTAFSL